MAVPPPILSLGYPLGQNNQSLAFAESLPEPGQDSAELACPERRPGLALDGGFKS